MIFHLATGDLSRSSQSNMDEMDLSRKLPSKPKQLNYQDLSQIFANFLFFEKLFILLCTFLLLFLLIIFTFFNFVLICFAIIYLCAFCFFVNIVKLLPMFEKKFNTPQ